MRSEIAGMVMSVWTSSSATLRPVNENSPSSGLWKSWKTASSPARWRNFARAMFPLKKKISAIFCLLPSWETTRLPVWWDPMRVWITVARSKNFKLPWSCLPEALGTLRVVVSRRLARTRQRLREKAGRVSMRRRNTGFWMVNSSACSGERTVALRGEPVRRASSPNTSPVPR